MKDWCVGKLSDGTQEPLSTWVQKWIGQYTTVNEDGTPGETFDRPCYRAIYRNLYDDPTKSSNPGCLATPGVGATTSVGFQYAQDLILAMITQYDNQGGRLQASESEESNTQLNPMIWDICSKTPGLCQEALYKYCATTTVNNLTQNVSALPWCGCYMPPEQYAKYTDVYEINRECTPTCNRKGVIQLPSDSGISTKICNQSTCVIDNVSIQLAQSTVGSSGQGIDFSQICSSCAGTGSSNQIGGACSCTIAGTTITAINSTIGNLSISQQCGSSAACYAETKNPDGTVTSNQIPCTGPPGGGGPNPYDDIAKQEEANRKSARASQTFRIFAIIAVAIIIVIIYWYYINPSEPRAVVVPVQPAAPVLPQPSSYQAPVIPPSVTPPASYPGYPGSYGRPTYTPPPATQYQPPVSYQPSYQPPVSYQPQYQPPVSYQPQYQPPVSYQPSYGGYAPNQGGFVSIVGGGASSGGYVPSQGGFRSIYG